MTFEYSEDALVEQPAIALFGELGWEAANCWHEKIGDQESTYGRRTTQDVVLPRKLREALEGLNPGLPALAIEQAILELTQDRSALSPVGANRGIWQLLRNGVRVNTHRDDRPETQVVRVIDWEHRENNDFFLASQLWVSGDVYKRRVDLIGFVNGLPLVFIELKASHRRLEDAFNKNLRDYKTTVPQLFVYNGLIVLSNGSETRVGSISSQWEHFGEWKRISDETEPGVVSLETVIRGTCQPNRLLDLIENFTVFTNEKGPLVKVIAKNHQYLGVNNAIRALAARDGNDGRLGVFWHTQGSGKSLSMLFFSQKVLRKVPGNWTFLLVTDRQELDDQLYKAFASADAVTENEEAVRATSGARLKTLLLEDHRYVFSLVQKFHTDPGAQYPKLSDRADVIVITDEAHRSQYDVLARNMRDALPNASFIGFTGTPLIAGEERTREVFGDYVSVYDFRRSWEDRATVPLFYENRIPELQLTNEHFREDMDELLDEAALDEDQEKKLEREFGREYHLITRDDRLERIAEDIVEHFMGRGDLHGKAMVVSIDKATAVKMYDKVRVYWRLYLDSLQEQLKSATDEVEREQLEAKIRFMQETDMAVVVSQDQNEVEDMKQKGLDILPHRRRMIREDLPKKFKDPDDPFRLVFVCAMWMTGFDVPSCSTIYLDKPMRNHTLMQTIARANRVFGEKNNGLIVDYVGVFRDLQKALAIYGSGPAGRMDERDMPVLDKGRLVETLRQVLAEADAFCLERDVNLTAIQATAQGFDRIKALDDAREALVLNDETKRHFLAHSRDVLRIFKAILPDARANEFRSATAVLSILAAKIRLLMPVPDISELMEDIETLLDSSVSAEEYVIKDPSDGPTDLGRLDFEALQQRFARGRKRTEAERLRATIERKLNQMVEANRTRVDFKEKFEELIERYNAGASNVEEFFRELMEFFGELNDEDKRSVSEGLTDEELVIFDLLTKPDMELTSRERAQVKLAARALLTKLKAELLVLDWRKRQQSRAAVLVAIEDVFDRELPDRYTRDVYRQKCDLVYQHVYDSYFGDGPAVSPRPPDN